MSNVIGAMKATPAVAWPACTAVSQWMNWKFLVTAALGVYKILETLRAVSM